MSVSMRDSGINNTFKKIIYESSEMVFLADDTYPYNIYYTNKEFEHKIGQFLDDKTLVGLGLDINSYIFNEELILNFMGVEYSFFLELPQENESNYFLFYKGQEIKGIGLPTRSDSQYFFRNAIDLIGIGQENFLTWVSNSVKPILGYTPDELTNIELCNFFHPEDLPMVKELLLEVRQERKNSQFVARILSNSGEYKWLDWHIHFIVGKFYAIGRDISAQKTDKSGLFWKNDLFQLGARSAHFGVWELDVPANQMVWGPELYHMFELPNGLEVSKEQSIEFCLPEFRQDFKQAIERLITDGEGFSIKVKIRSRELNGRWVRIIGNALSESGQIKSVFGSIQDITQDELALRELKKFRHFFDLAPESIMVIDLDGQVIYANDEANVKLGLAKEPGEYIGKFDSMFESREDWQDHISKLSLGQNKLYQTTLQGVAGNHIPVEVSSNLLQIGDINLVLAFSRDISDRVYTEKVLQDSSDFLQRLTEQVPGALYQFVLDKEGKMEFTYLSPGIKTILDLTEDDISSEDGLTIALTKVHPLDVAKVLTTTVSSAKKISPWICQFRVRKNDTDTYKWVMGAAKPELQNTGDIIWYGYLTDITEQKEFELKLKDAREAAEKANYIKSEFLSMISHELRTPLNAISGSVYTLLQDEHTSGQESALKTINFAVDNLIMMINDLLDFQKMEAGKINLEMNPMNLKEVISQVVNGLEFHAKDSQNQLLLNFIGNLDQEVKGDKLRLAQVLNNLLTNALKFTNKGQVVLTAEIKIETELHTKVYFEVKDNGIGIAKENRERIFKEFDQLQHSFSKKYGGTGLGLSITKKLLDQMGGQIDFESELGVGSSFFFELTFERVFSAKSQTIQTLPTIVDLAEVKLLMAEDNDVNALVLGKIIKKWGIQYDRVTNGKEAVEAVRKGNYDCVLMDIQMPVMNGFDATEQIKMFSSIPVIALSAAAKIDVMDRMEKSSFSGYVAKPIDASELLKTIKEVLGAKSHKIS
jgi:PAS domain S-box-containing protein